MWLAIDKLSCYPTIQTNIIGDMMTPLITDQEKNKLQPINMNNNSV